MTDDDVRDDRELMAAHVAGDPEAFTVLVRRHQQRLWAVAVRTLRDREAAADAVQDALLSAYRNAGSYRGDAAVGTWLYRVVVNACLDRVRKDAARPVAPWPESDVPARADEPQRVVDRVTVERALAQLPEAQRTCIVLVDLDGMSVAEAAAVLGVPPGTVKSRCSRGRATLAELLTDRIPRSAGNRIPPGHVAVNEPTIPGHDREEP